MLPELLERVDKRVLQLVECCENAIGEGLAQMSEDLLGRIEFWAVAWKKRGDACPVASSPGHCDDCPNYPIRPQWCPFPTRGADAVGRVADIGPPRLAAGERHLCPW